MIYYFECGRSVGIRPHPPCSAYLTNCDAINRVRLIDIYIYSYIYTVYIYIYILKTPTAMHRRPLLLCSMPSEVCFENSTSEVYGRTWEYIQLPLVFLKSFLFDCNAVVCLSLVPWGCLFAPVFSKVGAVPLTL